MLFLDKISYFRYTVLSVYDYDWLVYWRLNSLRDVDWTIFVIYGWASHEWH